MTEKKTRTSRRAKITEEKDVTKKLKKKVTKKPAKSGFTFSDIGTKSIAKYKYQILTKESKKEPIPYRIPFKNLALESISGGIIGGTFCEIAATSQGGKCLAKGTLVATVKGPRPIESLKVGDMVFGYNVDGSTSPTRVTDTIYTGRKAVHELRNKHNIFAEATLEHNWASTHVRGSTEKQHEISTEKLFKNKEYRVNKRFVDYTFGDVTEPHAYVIGALLGDGCSRQGVSNIHISSPDNKVPEKVQRILGAKECYKQSENSYTYVIANGKGRGFDHDKVVCNMYEEHIKDKYAHEKCLPFDVFSDWDRDSLLNLLAGLIDTDGSVCLTEGKYLTLSFSSTSDQLAELFRTLTYTIFQVEPRLHMDVREDRRDCFNYRLSDNPTVTRVLKKLGDKIETESKKYKPEYDDLPFHISDKYVGVTQGRSRIADAHDITVDNETHMFVLHSGLVAHNSFLLYEQMASCQEMGGVVLLNEGEGAFEESYAEMVGLDIHSGTFIYSNITNIQELYSFWINIVQEVRLKKKNIPILLGHDSFPTLNTKAALEKRGSGDQLGFEAKLKNRAWSEQMETFVQFLKTTKTTHLMINQFTKIAVDNKYQDPYVSLCEEKMQYWATQRFKGKLGKKITKTITIGTKEIKEQIGARTTWTTIKNRAVKPFQKVSIDILYSRGISKYSGLTDLLLRQQSLKLGTKTITKTNASGKETKATVAAVRLCGKFIDDNAYTYNKKAETLSSEDLKKIISENPTITEPIWTGTYDDGEDYSYDDIGGEEEEEEN